MIGDLFSTLDTIARVIGWGAILVGIGWFLLMIISAQIAASEDAAEREAMSKFQAYLSQEDPEKFDRYLELRSRYQLKNERVHWRDLAEECGVPMSEIVKKR